MELCPEGDPSDCSGCVAAIPAMFKLVRRERGILVGVSLTVTFDSALGPSRSLSRECWLTEGDPAMVGRCWRLLRSDASEALLMLLAGDAAVRCEEAIVARATDEGELLVFKLATR